MTTETFKMVMRDQILVVITASAPQRMALLDKALRGAGAKNVGPSVYAFRRDAISSEEEVVSVVGSLDQGECIYVVGAREGGLETWMFVPSRTAGGIHIGST